MEIGSEFSEGSVFWGENKYLNIVDYPKRYVLSGRTGLHLIAEELKVEISNILLPNYCCSSMILPFYQQGFNISFYDSFNLDNIVLDKKIHAILIMDYFGFLSEATVRFAMKCKNEGKIIIIDATQSAFSYVKTYELADYLIISYRKWFDCLSAVVYSKNGFKSPSIVYENNFYNKTWRNAAKLKKQYLSNLTGSKLEYLELYKKANQNLSNDYIGYTANLNECEIIRRADSSIIRKIRRTNAQYLINEVIKLSDKFDIRLIFEHIGEEDCPLFVPILLNTDRRAAIKKVLIDNGIYCPIHWPIDINIPHVNTLYHKQELSLICDQRYDFLAMRKQIAILTQALSNF